MKKTYNMGIDVGSTTVKTVILDRDEIIFKDFKESPYSLAAINGYFHMKNSESAKIITALECIRYQYSPEKTLQYINGKGSGI